MEEEKKRRSSTVGRITVLPLDIQIQILIRLPLQSLLVSKRVCKAWNKLILEPSFVKLHQSFVSVSPLTIILHSGYGRGTFGLIATENNRTRNTNGYKLNHLDMGLSHMPELEMVGSCNGLICFSSYDQDYYYFRAENYSMSKDYYRVVMCNPILGSHFTLPDSPRSIDICGHKKFGFGYIPSTGQYKVVKLAYIQDRQRLLFHVCTIQSGYKNDKTPPWRTISDDNGVAGNEKEFSNPAFFNGSIIWLAELGGIHKGRYSLIYFDIEKEQISQNLMLPRTMFAKNAMIDFFTFSDVVRIGVYYDEDGNDHVYICEELYTRANIWVMEDYKSIATLKLKWVIQISYGERMPVKLFKVLKDGKLLIGLENLRLAHYDPNTGVVEKMTNARFPRASRLASYVPSLLGCML